LIRLVNLEEAQTNYLKGFIPLNSVEH